MSKDFFEFSKEQYRQEMKENEQLYQKASFMLILLPLLCTTLWHLVTINLVDSLFLRVDILLYYLFFFIAVLAIIASWIFLFFLVNPSKYSTLANMDAWKKWRDDYNAYLNATKDKENSTEDALEEAWRDNLSTMFVKAQPINAHINERRRLAFASSIKAAAIAVAAIGMHTLFFSILKIQGVL